MPYRAIATRGNAHRIILQEEVDGTYVFVFEHASSEYPEKDWHYDSLDDAMRYCRAEHGISEQAWEEVEGDWL